MDRHACCGLAVGIATALTGSLVGQAWASVPVLPGAAPSATLETALSGEDWNAHVYSYAFDEDAVPPAELVLEDGELLCVYLVHLDQASESSIHISLVMNPCDVIVNTVGYLAGIQPLGYDEAMQQGPFLYGYSSPASATVWNYTGNPDDPLSTLDPGEWSLLYHVAEADAWGPVSGGVTTGGSPVLGEVLGPVATAGDADINGDGVVDVQDLMEILSHWGESGGAADIDGTDGVDVGDLLEVIANFGATAGC
jgi:hypothetical protein